MQGIISSVGNLGEGGGGGGSDANGLTIVKATMNYGRHKYFGTITSWQNGSSYNASYTDANNYTWQFISNYFSVDSYLSSTGAIIYSGSQFTLSHTNYVDFARVVLTRTGGTSSTSNPQVSFKCECYVGNDIVNTITDTAIFVGSGNYVFDIFNKQYDKIVISPHDGLSRITNPQIRIDTILGIYGNNRYSLMCDGLDTNAVVFDVPYISSSAFLTSINDLPFMNSTITINDLSAKCFVGFFDPTKQVFKKAELT